MALVTPSVDAPKERMTQERQIRMTQELHALLKREGFQGNFILLYQDEDRAGLMSTFPEGLTRRLMHAVADSDPSRGRLVNVPVKP